MAARQRALPKYPSDDARQAMDAAIARCAPSDPELQDWYTAYARNHKRRLAHDLDLVRGFAEPEDAVLDVGAVPPLLLTSLRELGYRNTVGLDLSPRRFGECISANELDVREVDIECDAWPVEPGSMDAVVFNEVFEHLRINPIATLRQAHACLRADGVLLLSTPNLYSAAGLYNLLVKGRAEACSARPFAEYQKLESLGHMGHVREYTARETQEFLESLGFRVDSVIWRGKGEVKQVRWLERMSSRLRPFVSFVARPI